MKIEGRRGIYDPRNCDVRIWKEKEGTRLGYDNIQCSSKKADGTCFCKRHKNLIDKHGPWWLGLITEPRPENPIHHLDPEEKKRKHNWLNDEVEEKEKVGERRRINARKSIEDMIKEFPSLANVKMIINGEELEGFFMKK